MRHSGTGKPVPYSGTIDQTDGEGLAPPGFGIHMYDTGEKLVILRRKPKDL